MNWDQLEGKWKQYSGKVREKWGKITDDDLTVVHGKRDQLIGKIRERYGIVKEDAEKLVDEFGMESAIPRYLTKKVNRRRLSAQCRPQVAFPTW
jgi:uncharacterized protein YjbJ (UPF0337 family)